jgi:hypothetical protein
MKTLTQNKPSSLAEEGNVAENYANVLSDISFYRTLLTDHKPFESIVGKLYKIKKEISGSKYDNF